MTGTGLALRPVRAGRLLRAHVGVELASAALALGAICVLLARQFRAPGSEMDEGAVLAFSGRVLHGAVPWRDFQTFYGPGNLWLVGGVSKVFGLGVDMERSVGLGYRLAVVLALYTLARRIGPLAGVGALAVCAFLVPGQGLAALALWGSLAFALAGLAVLVAAAARRPGRARSLLLAAAGALSACALLVRFDFVLVVALPSAVLLPLFSWRERGRALVAFAVVLAAYAPQLWLVGPGGLDRLVRQLRATEPGRRLPFPAAHAYPGVIFTPAVVVTVVLVVTGAVLLRAQRSSLEARVLLATGVFSAALLPTTLSRLDGPHVVPFGVVPLALLPALVTTLVQHLRASRDRGVTVPLVATVCALGSCAAAVAIVLGAPGAARAVVTPQPLASYRVALGDRWFPVGDRSEAQAAQAVVAAADRLARPGQSLFVGPADLRRTNYNDTYVYYLLPQLRPASFYMEMNPQTANRSGSGLASQVMSADWLILDRLYDRWRERNSSSKLGSVVPNLVVRRHFCVVAASGGDTLLRRCR